MVTTLLIHLPLTSLPRASRRNLASRSALSASALPIQLFKPSPQLFELGMKGLLFSVCLFLSGCGSSDSTLTTSDSLAKQSEESANSANATKGRGNASNNAKREISRQTNSEVKNETNKVSRSGTRKLSEGLVLDDGKTLWAKPTRGPMLNLSGVAEGAETVLVVRPQLLFASEEGSRFWRAIGPAGEYAKSIIETKANQTLAEIDRLVVSLGPGEEYGAPLTTLSVNPEKSDEVPLLRRELELLAESLDDDSHFTLLLSPKFMLGDGGGLLVEQWRPIRDLLTDLAGEDWQAASLTLHLGDRFYWELRVVGTAATRELTLARSLGEEAADWPAQIKQLVVQQAWPDYSRSIIQRTPQMMEMLAKYARFGADRRQTILNGYLPASAAHNLALSSELLLAGLGQTNPGSSAADSATTLAQTVLERLKTSISLEFRRESLETALQLLSDATNIPITLGGRDLQLEGITRNQMLGLDLQKKPASEVLVEILRRANPDPLATGPTDERQKLVYVLRKPDSDRGSIHITTRSAAKSRNEKLPSIFNEEAE